jgi:multicomponent Na+:H+ antiporter subunit E
MGSDDRILVPVADSTTLRQTVEYAAEAALETGRYVRFVYVYPAALRNRETDGAPDADVEMPGSEILDRVTVWASEDAGDREQELTVETATLGTDEYLFSPEDVAAALAEDARRHDASHVVLDPEYDPGIGTPLLQPLEYELGRYGELRVETAPVQRQARRAPLPARTSALQIGTLFGLSFVFYQVLAGAFVLFDLVTGAVSATVVAVGISRITLTRDPSIGTVKRVLRLFVYAPYLLYEIIKANVAVAAVILHPRMPIDPRMTRIRPAVWGALPVTTLANSITLTPGTLTVRVDGRALTVHTLIPAARDDLFDGGLERGVRFVFYGRRSMALGSLTERGEAEVLQPPANEDGAVDEHEHGGSDGIEEATGSSDDRRGDGSDAGARGDGP